METRQCGSPLAATHSTWPCQHLFCTYHSPIAQCTPLLVRQCVRSCMQCAKPCSAQLLAQGKVPKFCHTPCMLFFLHNVFARPFGRDGRVRDTPTHSFRWCGGGMDDRGDCGSQRCTQAEQIQSHRHWHLPFCTVVCAIVVVVLCDARPLLTSPCNTTYLKMYSNRIIPSKRVVYLNV